MKKTSHTGAVFLCYFLSAVSFLVAQLSVVSNSIMSNTALSYHYPLRIAVHGLSVLCAILGYLLWKTENKWKAAFKTALSAAMISLVILFGFSNNVAA